MLLLALTTVVIVLVFDYTNGFHDAANIVATVIASRAMTPAQAVRRRRLLRIPRTAARRHRGRPTPSRVRRARRQSRRRCSLAILLCG
jgi:hypothetical protein